MQTESLSFTRSFAELAPRYDVLLSDVWGVVHNGESSTLESCEALRRFRAGGGTVILITNAPRPGDVVRKFIDNIAVPRDAYDGIVSSGDVTRSLIEQRKGKRIGHLGPERDVPMFDGLDVILTPIEQADYVVVSGLYDDVTETPEDYRGVIESLRARNVPMICADPDVVVERGAQLVYCAGAIADLYAAAGGTVIFAGKPYRPIYQQAIAAAERARGASVATSRILAIGDSIRTDIKGAEAFGIDRLFVTAGIHAEEFGDRDNPDVASLDRVFVAAGTRPTYAMRTLAW